MSEEPPPTRAKLKPVHLVGGGAGGLVVGLTILFTASDQRSPDNVAPPLAQPPVQQEQALPPETLLPELELPPAQVVGRDPFSQLVIPAEVAEEPAAAPPASSETPPPAPAIPVDEGSAQAPPAAAVEEVAPPAEELMPSDTTGTESTTPTVDVPAPPPEVTFAPVAVLRPPVLLDDALWNQLAARFQSLQLLGIHEDAPGSFSAMVDAGGTIVRLTEQQTFLDTFLVEHIDRECVEISTSVAWTGRTLLRLCTPAGAATDLPAVTSALHGQCVEVRATRSFPLAPDHAELLERRVFVCRDAPPLSVPG
ncbi:MAG TPA: hypothetical protein VK988_16250 [Acidimicrobiales bacterium]|nr:hypothetical protein [Acidimicrobiales bacterium]